MPDDVGPGELNDVGAGAGGAEYPAVVPELIAFAEVPADDPAFRLIMMAPRGPLVEQLPQIVVQRREYSAGDRAPIVRRPALDDRVEFGDDRQRVQSAQRTHLGRESRAEPFHRRLRAPGNRDELGRVVTGHR